MTLIERRHITYQCDCESISRYSGHLRLIPGHLLFLFSLFKKNMFLGNAFYLDSKLYFSDIAIINVIWYANFQPLLFNAQYGALPQLAPMITRINFGTIVKPNVVTFLLTTKNKRSAGIDWRCPECPDWFAITLIRGWCINFL